MTEQLGVSFNSADLILGQFKDEQVSAFKQFDAPHRTQDRQLDEAPG